MRILENNFGLAVKEDPNDYVEANTLQIVRKLNFDINVLLDAQHDGNPWCERMIRSAENRLIEQIMNTLRIEVTNFVTKTNPFQIHRY